MKQLLSPPVFTSPAKNHKAFLLHYILLALILVPVLYLLFTLLVNPQSANKALGYFLSAESLNLFLFFLNRRGFIHQAAILQVSFFWLFFTTVAWTESGLRSQAYLLGYGVVILVAGFLLGEKGAILVTALSILSGAAMVYLESRGSYQFDLPDTPLAYWLVSIVLFPVILLLHKLANRGMQRMFALVQASELRYRMLVEQAPVGILILGRDGKIEQVNPSACANLGYSIDELVGLDPTQLGIPEEMDSLRNLLESSSPDETITYELRLRRRDGRLLDALGVTRRLPDGRMQFIAQDITSRKQTEEKIRQINESLELRVAQRTAELEAFTYTVSHDLRAPLRGIEGYSRIIQEEYAALLPQDGQQLLTHVRQSTQHMQELIDDLLTLSRLSHQRLVRQRLCPSMIVNEALAELKKTYTRQDMEISIAELPECSADPVLLKQVWINLLENSIKFTPLGKPVQVEILAQDGPNGPVYTIRDQGIGFDMKHAERIFEVFQRLHGPDEFMGTGVGLAIAQRIVQRHGGRIWADSQPGLGATFFFTLPEG